MRRLGYIRRPDGITLCIVCRPSVHLSVPLRHENDNSSVVGLRHRGVDRNADVHVAISGAIAFRSLR